MPLHHVWRNDTLFPNTSNLNARKMFTKFITDPNGSVCNFVFVACQLIISIIFLTPRICSVLGLA